MRASLEEPGASGAGIDIGKDRHGTQRGAGAFVRLLYPRSGGDGGVAASCGVTKVAMESTSLLDRSCTRGLR